MSVKKIFDEKGRLFGVLNILDLIAVVVVAALVFAVALRLSRTERYTDTGPVESGVEFSYTFRITGVRDYTVNAIRRGDEFFSNTNESLGKVVDISVSEAYENSETADGGIVSVRVPDRYEVVLTLETRGEIRGGRYYSDGAEISANAGISIHSKYVVTGGTVQSIIGQN